MKISESFLENLTESLKSKKELLYKKVFRRIAYRQLTDISKMALKRSTNE